MNTRSAVLRDDNGRELCRIVWNGCDNYVEADQAAARGHDFDGEKLYHGGHEFTAFAVTEISLEDLPNDDDGEPDFNGVLATETGKLYRAAQGR